MSVTAATLRVSLLAPEAQRRAMFGVLCLVWGLTWLAMKVGTAEVPPAFFSGVRWTAAGLVLLGWRTATGARIAIPPRLWLRLGVVAFLMIAFSSTIQLYGLRVVSSGLAAVLTSGLTPILLLAFSVMAGQERFSRRQAGAIALGLIGLGFLFGPAALDGARMSEAGGAALVLVGCAGYCAGSVLIRPALRHIEPQGVAAITNVIGGVTLLAGALLFEPGAWHAAAFGWSGPVWIAFAYLLLCGSLGASIIYFLLVRDWGASKTGTYSFVSPVIAVLAGAAINAERVALSDLLGIVLMLSGAAAALRRPARA